MTAIAEITAPDIDYGALSPLLALTGGACVTLMLGLMRGNAGRVYAAAAALATLAIAAGLSIWQLGENK